MKVYVLFESLILHAILCMFLHYKHVFTVFREKKTQYVRFSQLRKKQCASTSIQFSRESQSNYENVHVYNRFLYR